MYIMVTAYLALGLTTVNCDIAVDFSRGLIFLLMMTVVTSLTCLELFCKEKEEEEM